MRQIVRRLPGSRTLTPQALLLLTLVVGGSVVLAAVLTSLRDSSPSGHPLPLVSLDVARQKGVIQDLPFEPARELRREAAPQTLDIGFPLSSEVAPAIARPALQPAPLPAMPASVSRAVEDEAPTFNGRPLRKARTMAMTVTAYSPDERSCGKWADGKTASGYSVWTNGMKLVAADTRLLPFNSIISVPGYHQGKPVPVLDRGGAIKGHRLDVLYPTHEVAMQWGVQEIEVTVWEYAD